jgi:hypothetical protein
MQRCCDALAGNTRQVTFADTREPAEQAMQTDAENDQHQDRQAD